MILDGDRYDRMYEIYLDNKKIYETNGRRFKYDILIFQMIIK